MHAQMGLAPTAFIHNKKIKITENIYFKILPQDLFFFHEKKFIYPITL